jgi:hypothetical protein
MMPTIDALCLLAAVVFVLWLASWVVVGLVTVVRFVAHWMRALMRRDRQ